MNGLLLIDKPEGMTSSDIIKNLKRNLKLEKIGHTGTLDPVATGLLLICIGKATKLVQFLQELDKVYKGEITFGILTNTLDKEGEIIEEKDASNLKKEEVEKIFSSFQGEISQIPPMFSAVHWKGERLYKLARKGLKVKVPERKVYIYKLKLCKFSPGLHPRAEFQLRCSKGTYVRSLCRDIGRVSGYGAYQSFLQRIQIGPFSLKKALKMKDIIRIDEKEIKDYLFSLKESLPHIPLVYVKKGAEKLVKWGKPLYLPHIENLPPDLEKGDRVRLCNEKGELLSVGISLQSATHFSKNKIGFRHLRVLV